MERKESGFLNERAIVIPKDILNKNSLNPLTSLLYPTDIGYYPKAQGHFIERKTGSSQHILIYCNDGEGWYDIGKGKNIIKKINSSLLKPELPIYMVLPTQIHGVFTGFILPVKKVRYSLLFLIRHIPLPMTKRPDTMTEYKCLTKFWPIWKWDIALKTWNISHYAYGIYWAHSVMFHNSGKSTSPNHRI